LNKLNLHCWIQSYWDNYRQPRY